MESGKIIVVANQKGGVAKTSTVRNLSYALAEMGKKVLVVDFDPQYNLTTSFGVLPTQAPYNTGTLITNLLLDESLPDTNEFIQKIGSVDLIPSSRSLTVAEANLLMTPDSNDYLAALLNPLRLSYDYIIVDTNPSLGSLTINALTAADEVIIPIDPELFALTGLQALVDTIKKIKRKLNPSIEIGGILFTKCNKRTNLYRRTYGQVTKAFQSLPIFNCQIPYTVKVGDANSYGMSVMELEQAKGHLFTEIPAGGFEAQYIQLLTDSISYFIGKKCHLPDEEIQLSDGMATVSHFNTLPLVAHLGTAVTALSKGILLEVERNIKIINRERMAQHEQTEYQSEIQGAGRDDASRSANLQQQRSRSTSGQVRPDGPGIPQRESPGAIYDFENGWQSDGDHAPGTGRGDRENRSPDAANAPAGAASADRGHHGADATPEQSETDGGGNRTPERSPDSPLTEEQPNTEVAPSAAPVGEPSEKDGSFSIPAEQPTRHFTDAEVRRNYEYILTSTNLYPPELHSAVRSVLSEPPLNPDWSDKGRQIAALFTPYGDREYQGDLLYRTRLHGEDGISFFFDEGYTYIPWNGLAFLLDAMIEDGDYPNPVVEEQPDPIGDYNIPDEVDEMGGPHRQMTIGEADFDYVLDAVAYEAGETVVEPVKPQAIVQMENDTPAAGDEPASVPDENPPVVVEAPETARPTDTAEQPTPPPVKGNTTAHKNFRRFQELFPEIVSGQYEYLRLEAGEAYYPLVIHHKYGSHYCMEHYYI